MLHLKKDFTNNLGKTPAYKNGRTYDMAYKRITLCLNKEQIEDLGKLAKKKSLTRSSVSRLLFEDGLKIFKESWGVV
jgi:hypothetical protein